MVDRRSGKNPLLPWRGPLVWVATLGLLCVSPPGWSEEVETTDTQLWLDYDFYGEPKERLRTSLDLGYRQVLSEDRLIGEWLRLHLRGGVAWQAKDWLSLEGGIGGFYTHESDEEIEDTAEIRPWQGAKVSWPTVTAPRRIALTHFARLEQRIVTKGGQTSFDLRFRYRLSTSIPLNRPRIEEKTLYMPFSIEGFLNPTDAVEEAFADRLRITAGLGYVASPNWTFRLVYTGQKSRNTTAADFETTDHILRFSVITTVKIKDLIRTH